MDYLCGLLCISEGYLGAWTISVDYLRDESAWKNHFPRVWSGESNGIAVAGERTTRDGKGQLEALQQTQEVGGEMEVEGRRREDAGRRREEGDSNWEKENPADERK